MNTSVIDLSKANRRQELAPAQTEPSEMQALIAVMQQAISNPDIPIERMEKLVGIALDATERMDANRARKAYAAAMAEFKRNPPKIVKDAHVKYTTNKGTTEYDHATLGALCEAVIAGLAEVGISHEWQQSFADGKIQVTCILTHALGHKERFPGIPALPDDSGGKNAIQANQSTVTYLERSTLFSATGLAALAPPDNDGRGAPKARISEKEIANLEALLTEVGANKINFLKWAGVESLEQILATNYKACVQAIEGKRQ